MSDVGWHVAIAEKFGLLTCQFRTTVLTVRGMVRVLSAAVVAKAYNESGAWYGKCAFCA